MKHTEIGMIPDDWEVKRLGDLCIFSNGVAHEQYVDENGEFILVNSKFISSEGKVKKFSKKQLLSIEQGTILMVMSDVPNGKAIAKCFIVPENFRGTLNQRICMFSQFKADNEYIYRIINRNKYYLSFDDGVKQTNLRKVDVLNCPIPLPPTLAEQQKIAKALSDVDNVITTLEKLITKKKNLKQSTMQQLLTGKKRLPGFAPAVVEPVETPATKQTELGEIPADWEVVNIYKTCTIKARIGWQGLKSDEYLDTGDYVLVTGTDFDNGFINWKNCSYVSEWRYKQDKNIQIRKGDVLVTKDGTIGKIAFLNEIPMNGTLNSGVFVVRPKDQNRIDSVYLSLIFKSFWFDDFLEQITSGSTIIHLYQKDFVKFNFVLPEIKEQTAIANVLSSMDKEIEALEAKLGKYRDLKTGMMQQLLTGKIRLRQRRKYYVKHSF